jgi:hypothetical protein
MPAAALNDKEPPRLITASARGFRHVSASRDGRRCRLHGVGAMRWILPSGRVYTTRPTVYDL